MWAPPWGPGVSVCVRDEEPSPPLGESGGQAARIGHGGAVSRRHRSSRGRGPGAEPRGEAGPQGPGRGAVAPLGGGSLFPSRGALSGPAPALPASSPGGLSPGASAWGASSPEGLSPGWASKVCTPSREAVSTYCLASIHSAQASDRTVSCRRLRGAASPPLLPSPAPSAQDSPLHKRQPQVPRV